MIFFIYIFKIKDNLFFHDNPSNNLGLMIISFTKLSAYYTIFFSSFS